MINNKRNKRSKSNKEHNTKVKHNAKTFHSLKNNCDYEYSSDSIRCLMLVSEMDRTIDRYKPFDFTLVSVNDINVWDIYPGLVLESDGCRNFVIVSDRLTENESLTEQVAELLQQYEPKQIELQVGREDALENNVQIENIAFLYEFALKPLNSNTFNTIKDVLEFIVETTLGELRRCIKNDTAIYQLMFHQAIRADLENNNINDDLIVYTSPLINSIIRNL